MDHQRTASSMLFVLNNSLLVLLIQERNKRGIAGNAFSNDINKCLFTSWTTASGSKTAVLSKPVQCKGYKGSHVQLCYGVSGTAQFAVCYNKETLTPDFTGHIVRPNIQGGGRESDWRQDTGWFGNKNNFLNLVNCSH